MNPLVPFTFREKTIRTGGTPDAPVFVAKDVCEALEITWNGAATLAVLPAAWKLVVKLPTSFGEKDTIAITEAGVYKLAFRSNKPEAEEFTNWVAGTVLPAIRQTGRFEVATHPDAPDFSDPLTVARLYIEAETGKRAAERQLEAQAPAVAFARKVEMSEADISVGAFAKAIGWGPNRLHHELRRRGFTYRLDGHPMPKQTYVEQGLFRVKQVPSGTRVFPVMSITGKGQLRLAAVLGINAQLQLLAPPAA